MQTAATEAERGFWLQWVLANAVGIGLGALLSKSVSAAVSLSGAGGVLFGTVTRIAQWLALRRCNDIRDGNCSLGD